MKYKTLFRMLLKAVGVLLFAEGVSGSTREVYSIIVWVLNPARVPFLPDWTWVLGIIGPFVKIAFGIYLFFGGRWLADLAIPGNRPYCPECGYDLTGAARNRCPECDTPFRPEDIRPKNDATGTDAIE